MGFDAQMLVSALEAQGEAIAVVERGVVVLRNDAAQELGDLVALSREAAPRLVRGAAGRVFEVRATTVGEGGAEGGGEAVLVLGREVREREELRDQLARSNEILSLASHDLKGPLHVLGMVCHLMESRIARREPIDQATVDRTRRQVSRLDRLINQLLDVARIQEHRLLLDLRDGVDLSSLCREAIAQALQIDPARTGDLVADLASPAPARVDPSRILEVVAQLLDNAIRFTRPGTRVRLRLAAAPESGPWILTVSDEGAGVAPSELGGLFERASRRAHRQGAQGLGVGLYIAATVVKLHGGTIRYLPPLASQGGAATSESAVKVDSEGGAEVTAAEAGQAEKTRGATFEVRLRRA